ncbi:2TM domain-containing protein [Paraflavitalea speifideaquila]|uniref:2TM domain-containing protein n=1 Tax=Paraflavitalea speifideaquila TaxID=3076558 RepID=UPI0028E4625C|nr:2TM domain-containing protein [Paraflavitalea speifideiaquila]
MQNEKDPHLWEIAKRRASFKYHLAAYLLFNTFFWVIWFFTGQADYQGYYGNYGYPWPIWPMMGWGIGLVFHFLGAYVYHKENSAEREYEKLLRNRKQ